MAIEHSSIASISPKTQAADFLERKVETPVMRHRDDSQEGAAGSLGTLGPLPAIGRRWIWLGFALAFLPAMVIPLAIIKYGVNVPYWDEWVIGPPLFEKVANGTLGFSDLIKQHNEHRILMTRLMVLLSAPVTHFNLKMLMPVPFVVVCGMSVILYLLGCKTLVQEKGRRPLMAWFLANLMLFSIAQWVDWLCATTLDSFVPGFCLVSIMLFALSERSQALRFIPSMGLAALSTYSFANGLLLWFLPLPALLICGPISRVRAKLRWTAVWLATATLTIGSYLYDYRKPSHHPSLLEAFHHPLAFSKYFLCYLGSPISRGTVVSVRTQAIAVGSIAFSLFLGSCIYVWRRRGEQQVFRRALPWLTLGSYAICTAVVTALGRLGFGIDQSLELRYMPFPICLIVALIYLLPIVVGHAAEWGSQRTSRFSTLLNTATADGSFRKPRVAWGFFWFDKVAAARCLTGLAVALVVLQGLASVDGLNGCREQYIQRLINKTSVTFLRCVDDDIIRRVYPDDQIRHAANVLNALGYLQPALVDSPKITPLVGTPQQELGAPGEFGYIEGLQDLGGGKYLASGWAVFPGRSCPADSVVLTYQVGESEPIIFAVAEFGADRPDVAHSRRCSNYHRCGWNKVFSTSRLPKGRLKIQGWAFDTVSAKAFALNASYSLSNPPILPAASHTKEQASKPSSDGSPFQSTKRVVCRPNRQRYGLPATSHCFVGG